MWFCVVCGCVKYVVCGCVLCVVVFGHVWLCEIEGCVWLWCLVVYCVWLCCCEVCSISV